MARNPSHAEHTLADRNRIRESVVTTFVSLTDHDDRTRNASKVVDRLVGTADSDEVGDLAFEAATVVAEAWYESIFRGIPELYISKVEQNAYRARERKQFSAA
jgi:hypothetical protein